MDLLICGAHHQKWDIKGLIPLKKNHYQYHNYINFVEYHRADGVLQAGPRLLPRQQGSAVSV